MENNLIKQDIHAFFEMAPRAREKRLNSLALEEQLTLVLLSPWEKRNEIIISSRRAGELVQAIPAEELFWTVKAAGPEDSATILTLASPAQLQLFFDLDWWFKAEIKAEKVAAWLLLMFECARPALKEWLKWVMQKDVWLMAAAFSRFVSVVKRPDDMDIQEAKDLLPPFTIDNVYYLAFKNQKLAPLFSSLIGTMLEISPALYRDLFETMLGETPSHNLETAYRFRCGRLQDFGIPDYYDSLNIYLPMKPEEMHRISPEHFRQLPTHDEMPAFVPTLYVSGFPVLEKAVRVLAGDRVMERIVREITGIANKVMMADLIDLDDPEDLKDALEKTFSMLNLGMEYLAGKWSLPPEEILSSCFLEEIVRVGCRFLLSISTGAAQIAARDSASFLPYELREQLKAASRRPAMLFDDISTIEIHISSLDQLHKCRQRIRDAAFWCDFAEGLSPALPEWAEDVEWKKTNFLAVEEFTAEAALSTAAVNLVTRGRFEVRVLNGRDLSKFAEILAGVGVEKIVDEAASALKQVAARRADNEYDEDYLKTTMRSCLEKTVEDIEMLDSAERDGLRFLKAVLVETD